MARPSRWGSRWVWASTMRTAERAVYLRVLPGAHRRSGVGAVSVEEREELPQEIEGDRARGPGEGKTAVEAGPGGEHGDVLEIQEVAQPDLAGWPRAQPVRVAA